MKLRNTQTNKIYDDRYLIHFHNIYDLLESDEWEVVDENDY